MRRIGVALGAVAVVLSGCAGVGVRGSEAGARGASPARAEAFHVEVTGHGRPMILIPGLASAGAVWDETVARYQDRFECHVLTLAGFAGQPAIDGPFLATERDAVLQYIAAHRLDHPVIVGHSLGGELALMIAEAAPDSVGPLMIVDSLPFLGGAFSPGASLEDVKARAEQLRQMAQMQTAEQRAYFRQMSLRSMITDPARIELVNRWGVRSDQDAVTSAMVEATTIDLRPELARIHVPVTVIATWIGQKAYGATHDSVAATFRAQYAALPQARLVVSDTAKHFVMWDDAASLYRELDALVRAVDLPAAPTAAR